MAKYRTFTREFKAQHVLEVLSGAKTAAEICREYHLKDSLFSKWKSEFLQNAHKAFEPDPYTGTAADQIAELEQVIGRLTVELEIAKKASNLLTAARRRNGR